PYFYDSSLVLHYDGVSWKEHRLFGGKKIQSMCGSSSSDLWVGGVDGTLFHYNGTVWRRDSVRLSYPKDGTFQILGISKSSQGLFLIAGKYDTPTGLFTNYFCKRENELWLVLDSCGVHTPHTEEQWGVIKLWTSPQGKLYSVGLKGIYRFENEHWERILISDWPISNLYGISGENMFAVGYPGRVYHYNGKDWYQYNQFANSESILKAVWTDGKEVFVVGFTQDNSFRTTTVILRGK
ncbi:MAG: hypothetical protein HYV29_08135, partial [Ignavibacteriales bacterium]|nr:hypothetical protein [Ignavibacteriales bacterium]